MYFSKNSRYVLQKAQFLSPAFFRKADRNLSVKKPKDDPSKPPLRMNIPDDSPPSDSYSRLPATEPRSRSLISKSNASSIDSDSEGDFLPKSESETQFSKLALDDTLVQRNYEDGTLPKQSSPDSELALSFNLGSTNPNQEDYNSGFYDGATFYDSTHYETMAVDNSVQGQTRDVADSKTLYIIIDVPEKNDGKHAYESSGDSLKDKSSFQHDSALSKLNKLQSDRSRSESFSVKKSQSLPQYTFNNLKSGANKRFEVHEVEDAATYIFHLRLNKNIQSKANGVGCVPEKEITTRAEISNYNDAPIRVREADTSTSGLKKGMASAEELTGFIKSMEGRKKQKQKGGEPVVEVRNESISKSQAQEPVNLQQKYLHEVVNHIKEDKKNLPKFERDDFGTIRTAVKNYPFKMPGNSEDFKQEEGLSPEPSPDPKVQGAAATMPDVSSSAQLYESSKMGSGSAVPVQENASNYETLSTQEPFANVAPSNESQQYSEPESGITVQQYDNTKTSYISIHESVPSTTPQASNQNAETHYYKAHNFIPLTNSQKSIQNVQYGNKSHSNFTQRTWKPSEKIDLQYYSVHDQISEPEAHDNNSINEEKPAKMSDESSSPQYYSIHEIKPEHKEQKPDEKKKKSENPSYYRSLESQSKFFQKKNDKSLENEKPESEASDFQTSTSFVNIRCEKSPSYPMKFGAAFPPLLREALNNRFKLRRDVLFSEKWSKLDMRWKDVKTGSKGKVSELSEYSILFPKEEGEKFDCNCLFSNREDVIFNIIKNSEEENCCKLKTETSGFACQSLMQDETKAPMDTLTVMKKVKEIIQFDLENAVKIFKDGGKEPEKDSSSVLKLNGNKWEVDNAELEAQMNMRQKEVKVETSIDQILMENFELKEEAFGDRTEFEQRKYLPGKVSEEMKLNHSDSTIWFNPETNEFVVNEEALAEAIHRRTNEPFDEVFRTLSLLANDSNELLKTKGGDSIVVFDEETQSWKVDFSILEKRQKQLQVEEELMKTSELILETFENLEKNQYPRVPKPITKEKKTFDYKKEQWKSYGPEKHSGKEKSTKSKDLFKESNAEEVRKKNSNLYEDLFTVKKKDASMNKSLNSTKTGKESKSRDLAGKKEATSTGSKESTPIPGPPPCESTKSKDFSAEKDSSTSNSKESGSTPKEPNIPRHEPTLPPVEQGKPKIDEDNFWESFLNLNILPRDISEIPKNLPLQPPASPKTPSMPGKTSTIRGPSPASPPPILPKIDESKPEVPEKKIEEPRFKIHLPFIRDKKIDKQKGKKPPESKNEPKVEAPEKKPFTTPGADKKKEPVVKTPPSPAHSPKEDPKPKDPSHKLGSRKPKTSNQKPSIVIQEPKSSSGSKTDKTASESDHYVSDKIIEISRSKTKEIQPQIKTNKLETVKLNITTDKRLPSKITEINLNKQCDEKVNEPTEVQPSSATPKKASDDDGKNNVKPMTEQKPLYRSLDKYKTPFSDPAYEEKSMKIKSDIESNPNLKKLDTWHKTLVLHDIMKPPENIESWLKDETDKMATLLLKILQEAADGKPKKKPALTKRTSEKQYGKGNPYENIRKKQEVAPDHFLFRVRTVNLSLENDKKTKPGEEVKLPLPLKTEQLKDVPVQSSKTAKPAKAEDAEKSVQMRKTSWSPGGGDLGQLPLHLEEGKSRFFPTTVETALEPKEHSSHQGKFPVEITEDIPGPEILKKISNAWKVFPILGSQMTVFTLLRLFQLVNLGSSILGTSHPERNRRHAFSKLFTKYGPIVNVQGPLSGNVILIHKPEHLSAIFEQDSTIPVRSVFDSLEQSRQYTEEKVFSVGVSTNWSNPEWNELKRGTIDPLTKGCEKYFQSAESAGESLVNNVRKNKNSQNLVSEDFMGDIRRWSLEGVCNVLFEKSFGFLEGRTSNMSWIMEPDKLYMAIDEATNCLNRCERGFQAWRLMATPSSNSLGEAYRTLSSILSKQLYQAEVNLKNKSELVKEGDWFPGRDLTFIEGMLLNDGMTNEEVSCNLIDIVLIATNTMNSSMGFLLYNLSQNVKIQNKLLKELKEALPHKTSRLDYNKLRSFKYLQACLKENLRMHMPVPLFYRLLQNDILLSNYIVPKGTYVVMDYRVSSMKEQIFDDPDKFIPERWLNDEKWMEDVHPFASFPICHGPRGELVKRVVEMQLWACAAKIIRNFQVEYHYGEIQGTDTTIIFPNKPLKFNFIERES